MRDLRCSATLVLPLVLLATGCDRVVDALSWKEKPGAPAPAPAATPDTKADAEILPPPVASVPAAPAGPPGPAYFAVDRKGVVRLDQGKFTLLASSPDWRPPLEIHGRQFYALYNTLREKRDRAESQKCVGELMECRALLQESTARVTRLQGDFAVLKKAFGEQEVEVREKVARNRAVALIPFGVGHFYNGRKGLGALFLTSEIVFGGIGLGLFIERTFNCSRTNGFRPNSLQCKGTGKGDPVVARRDAEQTMGLLFLGTIALDIVLAQVTFRPFLTVKTTRVRRQDLEKETDPNAPGAAGTDPRPGKSGRAGKQPRPRSRTRTHDILRARPVPAFIPGGGGLGLSLEF